MKTKNVLFKVEMSGHGIVNYDSNDQKYVLKNTHLRNVGGHSNVSYAKKNLYIDDDGNTTYKVKISSDALKNNMFRHDVIAQTPNIAHHDALLYSYIASPLSLVRGYLFANKSETVKRKGAITMSSAEQTCNAMSKIEVFSRSGEKQTNDGSSDKSDNSFYSKETIGDVKYQSMGNIDLMSLQFVSCDSIFDRYSFNPDKYHLYKQFLAQKLPGFDSDLGYYQLKNTSIDIPEYGVLLSEENVVTLIKDALKKIFNINIKKKDAFAKVETLKIKLVNNPTEDTFSNEDGWMEITSEEDIDNLDFDPYMFYEITDTEDAKNKRQEIKDEMKRILDEEKKKEKSKKSNKKDDE
ncbi:MAG: hypothetical protein ACOC2U_00470 [bacterium]